MNRILIQYNKTNVAKCLSQKINEADSIQFVSLVGQFENCLFVI